MKHRKPVELVTLDIWGTLIRSNPAFKKARAEAIARVLGRSVAAVEEAAFAVDRELDETTERTGEDFDLKARVRFIAAKLRVEGNISDKDVKKLEAEICKLVYEYPPSLIEEGILEVLRDLRKSGVKLVTVSNTGFISGKTMRGVLKRLGIHKYLDYAVFSDEVKVAKPHMGMFERAAKAAKTDLSRTLHVGDSYRADYAAARRAGSYAILFGPAPTLIVASKTETLSSLRELVGKPPAFCTGFALYDLEIQGERAIDEKREFDPMRYSRFKYGDGEAAEKLGFDLAREFIVRRPDLLEEPSDLVLTTSPYMHIPKGAATILEAFRDYLNQYLFERGRGAVSSVVTLRTEAFEGDYGTFDEASRKKMMRAAGMFAYDSFIAGKNLVLIDDVRITGSHEQNMLEFFGDKDLQELCFLYIAAVDPLQAKGNPQIESKMNHAWVNGIDRVSEIMRSPRFALNARVCKYILSHGTEAAAQGFYSSLLDERLRELYVSIVAEGYAAMPSYRDSFSLLRAEMEKRGYLKGGMLTNERDGA